MKLGLTPGWNYNSDEVLLFSFVVSVICMGAMLYFRRQKPTTNTTKRDRRKNTSDATLDKRQSASLPHDALSCTSTHNPTTCAAAAAAAVSRLFWKQDMKYSFCADLCCITMTSMNYMRFCNCFRTSALAVFCSATLHFMANWSTLKL